METSRKSRLAARDKKSMRQIARDLRLSRNTVRKVLRSGETRFEYHREAVHRPQLAAYVGTLEGGFVQVAEGRASVTGTKHVSSISRHKSPHPRYRMPWREGHDSLLPAIDDAPVETDCGAGYEHSRIVAHVPQNESRAFGVLALGYVRVTLQHDCSRIDPGSAAQMA